MNIFCKVVGALLPIIVACGVLASGGASLSFATEPTNGPLSVHPENPRYFADASGRAIYVTGSHSWDSLRDWKPGEFDFDRYLKFLNDKNHNFVRLWAWDLPKFDAGGQWELKADFVTPFPWMRTGPGVAADGRPKFDFEKFDSSYFERLRERMKAARDKGVYMSVMLFEGWNAYRLKDPQSRNTHPFIASNNVNGIDVAGDSIYSLDVPEAVSVQEAYVRKVIDTVNDLDNVLYEIINEAHPGSKDWQYHMINLIHEYEKSKPQQHPVGMTHYGGKNPNEPFFESPADWISPGSGIYYRNPPASDGSKVIINDSDHVRPLSAKHPWVWKSFCRGMNVILMDCFTMEAYGTFERATDAGNNHCRAALGHTKSFADRIDLAQAVPHGELSSTEYCLASPGHEYLVYQPEQGDFTVKLETGDYLVEWFNPVTGVTLKAETISSKGGQHSFHSEFKKDSVLYLKRDR